MRSHLQNLGIFASAVLLVASLSIVSSHAADNPQTLTGQVSDAMCGAKHMMAGNDAECTRTCVKKGSKYTLIVGDKVYTLDTSDMAALEKLDKLAGENAKVTGTVNGDTIQVSSVAGGQ